MEIKKIRGIVIRDTNYGESSKILNILTEDLGILSVISKGCRKIKSTLRGVSNKLVYGNFIIYYKSNGLSILKEVELINGYKNILTNITNISYANYIVELAEQVYKQNNDLNVFKYCISSLNKINENINPLIITNILRLKYLKYLGVDINVNACNVCGKSNNIINLSIDKGGYVCKNCNTSEVLFTDKTIKVIRLLYFVDIDKITKLELSENTIKELTSFLEDYYNTYTGLYIKSKDFLKIINKIK